MADEESMSLRDDSCDTCTIPSLSVSQDAIPSLQISSNDDTQCSIPSLSISLSIEESFPTTTSVETTMSREIAADARLCTKCRRRDVESVY